MARPLARKWPERPGSESVPSKESLHIWTRLTKNLGRFLANGLATLWPLFFSMFRHFVSNVSLAGLKLGPHFGHESWPPPCLGGAVWSGSLGNHFGGRLGESSGEFWGARGGQVEVCLGNGLESTLEAPFDHFTMTTWRRHNHNPRCRYKKTFQHCCKSNAKSQPVYGHDAKLICCTFI